MEISITGLIDAVITFIALKAGSEIGLLYHTVPGYSRADVWSRDDRIRVLMPHGKTEALAFETQIGCCTDAFEIEREMQMERDSKAAFIF